MKDINAKDIISALIAVIFAFIAWQSTQWTDQIKGLSKSVNELNTKMEVIINEVKTSKDDIATVKDNYKTFSQYIIDHEKRISELEALR